MTYISILDYETGRNLIIEDEEDITYGLDYDDVEVLLSALGFHSSEINWMKTNEDPGQSRTTLRELSDENYDKIESECVKRLLRAEDHD